MPHAEEEDHMSAASILVLGATGMLGQALMTTGRAQGMQMLGAARTGTNRVLDIEDTEALANLIANTRPAIIINAAALAGVALCEREPGRAYAVNARCVAVLAEAARACGAWLVQVSTDHYFSGDGCTAHGELSTVRLLNEYARSKYAGESFALTYPGALVLRTNIVGFRGHGTPTFVEWILNELKQEKTIQAFDDYFVSSLTVRQFSVALFDLLPKRPTGILNLGARNVFSKKSFIEGVRDSLMDGSGRIESASVDILTGCRRAESLGLDVSRAEQILGRPLPTLAEVVANLAVEFQERKSCVTIV
jgi:dTDP-4-dehydrorhamnose reductase